MKNLRVSILAIIAALLVAVPATAITTYTQVHTLSVTSLSASPERPLCTSTSGTQVVNCNVATAAVSLPSGCTGNLNTCFSTSVAIANHGYCWANWATTTGTNLIPLPFLTLVAVPTDTGHVQVTLYFGANATTGGFSATVDVFCNP